MLVCGIDPGLNGAIAFMEGDEITTHVMPTIENSIDIHALCELLIERKVTLCVLEKVGAMPKQGVTSMFNFGKTCGLIEGALAAYRIPYQLVAPQTWQKLLLKDVKGVEPKARALMACKRLYPSLNLLATARSRVPHDGIVDSVLIAKYATFLAKSSAL
jgi:crossover junction endodeoxyribonuclease RuvC